MSRFASFCLGVAVTTLVALSLGCSAERQDEPTATTASPKSSPTFEEHSEMNEAFAKLSLADQKLAEAQIICPVSDEPLGSMGTPIKVTVEGRDVFVCCEGCVDQLKSNFNEYVAKLDQKPEGE